MNIEEKFNSLLEKSKAATLSPAEKEKIKSYLLDFMAKNPVMAPALPGRGWFAGAGILSQPTWQFATSGLAVLLVLLFAGVGISFAAQNALPGDFLYPVKTGVTEKVLGWTKFSDQAKAQYDLSLVQTRLEEIETVTTENKLNASTGANVKQLLDGHIADLNKHVQNSTNHNQPDVGIEVNTRLEDSLNAHAKVLGSISAHKPHDATVKDNVDTIVSDLQDKANEAKHNLHDTMSGKIEGNILEHGADSNSGENGSGAEDNLHDIISGDGGIHSNIK